MATLEAEGSGRFITKIDVWTIRQKSRRFREVAVVERWPLVEARLYQSPFRFRFFIQISQSR